MFLNLALFFSIYQSGKACGKHEWSRRFVLITAILTTQSTVGYVVLMLNAIVLMNRMTKNIKQLRLRVISWFAFVLAVVAVFWMLYQSTAIQEKLFMENGSTTMRLRDLKGSIELIKELPVYGVGVNTLSKDQLLLKKNIVNNSVGIFASTINYGIIYMFVYLCMVLRNIKYIGKIYGGGILLLGMILLFSFSQSVFEFPLMFLFLFRFRLEAVT